MYLNHYNAKRETTTKQSMQYVKLSYTTFCNSILVKNQKLPKLLSGGKLLPFPQCITGKIAENSLGPGHLFQHLKHKYVQDE